MFGIGRRVRVGVPIVVGLMAFGVSGLAVASAGASVGVNPVVSIAPPPDPIAPGAVVTSPVTVANTGDTDSGPVTVVVSYPKYVSGSAKIAFSAAAGITCSVYSPRYGSRRATCTVPTLLAGATASVATMTVTAPASVPYAGITVSVNAAGPLNSSSATYRIRASGPADLVPSLYVSPSLVIIDRPATATITIADNGYSSANAFSTRIDLPAGSTPGVITPPAGTTCATSGAGYDCDTTSLANGASMTLTVPFNAPHTGTVSAVSVAVDTTAVVVEANEANNTASATLDVRGSAAAFNVAITNPATTYQGSIFTRTIEVGNVGGSTAAAVALTDRFTGIGYVGFAGPAGTSCHVATSYSGRPARIHYIGANCTLGNIAAGSSVSIDLQLSAPGTLAAGSYTDTATATTPDYTDPTVNPSATGTTTIAVPAVPLPPANTVAPALSGDPNVGSTVSATNGTWVAKGALTYAYRWLRCDSVGGSCVEIAGATANSYMVTTDDVGSTLRGVVDATNAGGTASANSAPSALVVTAAAPVNVVAPQLIPGLEKQPSFAWGVSPGTWNGTPTITFTYQWTRCNIAGNNCVDIAGATAQSYVLQGGDVFHSVRVRVTATNTGGSTTALSNASPEIDPFG